MQWRIDTVNSPLRTDFIPNSGDYEANEGDFDISFADSGFILIQVTS